MAGIREEQERWETATVKKAITKFPERRERFATNSYI